MHKPLLFTVGAMMTIVAAFCDAPATAQGPADRPNVVFLMADDMGYGDAHCFNARSTILTPHIDALATGGMRFTDAHTPSAVCTPTRYGVLTGRYSWRGRLKRGVLGGYSAPLIEPGRLTVAGLLKRAGYQTACIGKWHLGLGWQTNDGSTMPKGWARVNPDSVDWSKPLTAGPHTVGFDYSYIIPASLDMTPYVYIENGRVVEPPTERVSGSPFPVYYRGGAAAPSFRHIETLDHLTDKACDFIRRSAGQAQPFFLYYALPSPHKPIVPAKRFQGKSKLGPYGDYVMQVDEAIGKVDQAIQAAGIAERTVVFFTSDNGSYMYSIDRSPNFADDRDNPGHPVTPATQGYRDRQHRANGLWRGTKADIWEGGHRVPFIVRWPGRVRAGTQCDKTICHVDLMATCAELAGTTLPDDAGEDSFSIVPLLTGRAEQFKRAPVIHHSVNGGFALRDGRWKMVFANGSCGREHPRGKPFEKPFFLFDMQTDPTESTNVIDQHPDIARRMEAKLRALRDSGRSR